MDRSTEQDGIVVKALEAVHLEILADPALKLMTPSADPNTSSGRLLAALRDHPVFGREQPDSKQANHLVLNAFVLGIVIPRPLRRVGPRGTLDWLYKLHSTTIYERRLCGDLIGVETAEVHTFSNGVRIMPRQEMRDSPMHRLVWPKEKSGLADFRAESCGLTKVVVQDTGKPRVNAEYQDFLHIALGLTVGTEGSPVVGTCWDEFEDEELGEATLASGFTFDQFDGRPPMFEAAKADSEAIRWTERFLTLSGPVREACIIAATKLNLAKRRRDAGDSIIELSTAFEALLATRDERTEMTYRFRLRAALLLASDLDERRFISKSVAKLYQLRGKVVHGDAATQDDAETQSTREWGISAVRSLLRMIVEAGSLPDLSTLELTGDRSSAFSDAQGSKV